MRKVLAALLALCALATNACGTAENVTSAPAGAKRFTVMLDWFPNADHAPLYAAIAHGYFRAVGLDVQPVIPSESAEPLKLLAAGRVDAAISYEPQVLLARDAGLQVVSIGALVQRPLTSIIAPASAHVTSVAALAGKKVGTAGIPYQAAELHAALRHAGVSPASVREVNVGFNLVPAMLSHEVAATLGGFWNYEGIQLQLRHQHPTVIPIDQAGVPTYDELVVVVRSEAAHHDGVDVRAFLQALTRGERAVRTDPRAAAKLADGRQPLARRKAPGGVDRTHAAGRPASGRQAVRLPGPEPVGGVRAVDV